MNPDAHEVQAKKAVAFQKMNLLWKLAKELPSSQTVFPLPNDKCFESPP